MGQISIGSHRIDNEAYREVLSGHIKIDSNNVAYFREGGVQFNAVENPGVTWESRDYLHVVMMPGGDSFTVNSWNSDNQAELLKDFKRDKTSLLKIKEISHATITPTVSRSRTYIPVKQIKSLIETRDDGGLQTRVQLKNDLWGVTTRITATTLLKRIPKEERKGILAIRRTRPHGKRKYIQEAISVK